jgi:hypothetical protein
MNTDKKKATAGEIRSDKNESRDGWQQLAKLAADILC